MISMRWNEQRSFALIVGFTLGVGVAIVGEGFWISGMPWLDEWLVETDWADERRSNGEESGEGPMVEVRKLERRLELRLDDGVGTIDDILDVDFGGAM